MPWRYKDNLGLCCNAETFPVCVHQYGDGDPRLEINVGWGRTRLDYSHADFFIRSNYCGKNLLVTPGQRGRPPR